MLDATPSRSSKIPTTPCIGTVQHNVTGTILCNASKELMGGYRLSRLDVSREPSAVLQWSTQSQKRPHGYGISLSCVPVAAAERSAGLLHHYSAGGGADWFAFSSDAIERPGHFC